VAIKLAFHEIRSPWAAQRPGPGHAEEVFKANWICADKKDGSVFVLLSGANKRTINV